MQKFLNQAVAIVLWDGPLATVFAFQSLGPGFEPQFGLFINVEILINQFLYADLCILVLVFLGFWSIQTTTELTTAELTIKLTIN